MKTRKTLIGIVRDHSGSMGGLATAAKKDYNALVASIAHSEEGDENEIVYLTAVECDSRIVVAETNTPINRVQPLTNYRTHGGTPLLDSVMKVTDILESVPKADGDDVAYLVMVITDGGENESRTPRGRVIDRINKLTATNDWTFTFRVPKGYSRYVSGLGIPEGNIIEWDQTEQALNASSQATQAAVTSYMADRKAGVARSSTRFYADVADIKPSVIKANLTDISSRVKVWKVQDVFDGSLIQDFVEKMHKPGYEVGKAYYQLSKPETIQPSKSVLIRHNTSGAIYEGPEARKMMGLPDKGSMRVHPGNLGEYSLFVQSKSINRKLVKGTDLVYFV